MKTTGAILLAALLLPLGACCEDVGDREPVIKPSFDDSAARYVLQNPARALQIERDSIWSTFEAYRITLVWHEGSSVPVTWDIWERGLNRFLQDTSLITKSLALADSLGAKAHREHSAIVHHLTSYLGENVPLDASVHFTAFTIPYAFCVERNKIGIDITGDEWHFDTDCILNTVIHEIFHVGFRATTPDVRVLEDDPTDAASAVRCCYAILQNEGMATYVGYTALNLYPSEYRHDDYLLLEDSARVADALSQVNGLIADADTVALDTLLQRIWYIGVNKRAFYVAGAHMARVIEAARGTTRLAALVREGSLPFTREYNALVPENRRIVLSPR